MTRQMTDSEVGKTEGKVTTPPRRGGKSRESQGRDLLIYESLLRKMPFKDAAILHDVSYKTVYLLARKLEAQGVLRRDALRYPVLYLRGPNADAWDVRLARFYAGKPLVRPGEQPDYPMECRVHGGSMRCEITSSSPSPATRSTFAGWENSWNAGLKGNVPHAHFSLNVTGISLGVQFIGVKEPSVILYPPAMYARTPKELLDIMHRQIPDLAKEAIRTLAKSFNVTFSDTVTWNQVPEFAFPDTNGILALSREAYFRIHGEAWVDGSEGPPEYETRSLDLAILAFSIPSLLRSGHLQWVDKPTDSQPDKPDYSEGKAPTNAPS